MPTAQGRGVGVGGRAPDLALRDGGGNLVRLAAFWAAAPQALVLVFPRHFG